jgi:hypothetical protein
MDESNEENDTDFLEYYIDYFYNINWFNILIYIIALIALYAAYILEYKDLFCPYEKQEPKIGNGSAYCQGKPKNSDGLTDTLRKIRISSRYDEASVYWRRCIIYSVVLTFTICILVLQRLPNAYESITTFILLYLSLFLFLNYYQQIVSRPATEQVNELVNKLERYYR